MTPLTPPPPPATFTNSGLFYLPAHKHQPSLSLSLSFPPPTLTNNGNVEGKEVVQLYTRDLVGSSTRPVKELKGFQKVSLKPGESKEVSFTISENDLRFYNSDLKYVAEPGDFKLFIGSNSHDVKEVGFTLK